MGSASGVRRAGASAAFVITGMDDCCLIAFNNADAFFLKSKYSGIGNFVWQLPLNTQDGMEQSTLNPCIGNFFGFEKLCKLSIIFKLIALIYDSCGKVSGDISILYQRFRCFIKKTVAVEQAY